MEDISDESDFWGGEQIKLEYESKVASLDPTTSRNAVLDSIDSIARRAKKRKSSERIPSSDVEEINYQLKDTTSVEIVLHNPYEGVPTARQLSEPIASFLSRMDPVSVGPNLDNEHWIWIADFHASLNLKLDSETEHSQHAEFMKRGNALLFEFLATQAQIVESFSSRTRWLVEKKISPVRDKLKQDILNLAISCRITSGKWLLFPPKDNIRSCWSRVANSTSRSLLGPLAKISCDIDDKERRIYVYTLDFSNKPDVERVLLEIKRLGLMPKDEGRHLYYKCDAYTYLGIQSGNDYGLEASLYSSKTFLDEVTKEISKSADRDAQQKKKK